MGDHSENTRAEQIMGRRDEKGPIGMAIDFPAELGYRCPVHKLDDETLKWSEYNGFLWCELCDKDYPSALCCGDDLTCATEVFLNSVHAANLRARKNPAE